MQTSTLLPTPKASEHKGGTSSNKYKTPSLGKLISLPGAFPASPFRQLENDSGRRITATSGRRCLELYELLNRHGSLLKTCVASLLGTTAWYSSRSALTWKEKVTKSNRLLFQLLPSTLPTGETESGLLRTPDTGHRNGHGAKEHGKSEGQIFSPQNATQLKRPIGDEGKRIITYPDCNEYNGRPGEIREAQSVPGFSGEAIQPGEFVGTAGRWEEDWQDVATRLCGVDDGLPVGLDRFKLTKAAHRIERLKSLGNSIVPQVAIEIMRAIYETTI